MRPSLIVPLMCLLVATAAGTSDAIQLIQAGRFGEAAAGIRQSLKQAPGDPQLWNLLGICESEQNHTVEAREAFERGLALAPRSAELNENAGLLYFRLSDYASAKRSLSRAVELGSSNPGTAYSLAAARLRTGERGAGLRDLRSLESKLNGNAEYWAERGWAELTGDARAAAAAFDRALNLAPNDARALNGAASAAERMNNDERALSFLLRAKQANPGDVRTLLHFATVCLRRDLAVDARAAAVEARRLAPANNLALFLAARSEIAFQQWQTAHDLFTEFDGRVPNYAPAQYALGWLDVKRNRPAEARHHLYQASGIPDAVYELALLDLSEDALDDAQSRLHMVLAKSPNHAAAHVALGDVFLKRGDLAEARAQYERAITANPRSGPAHYKLSTVLIRLNAMERATEERELGIRLNAEATRSARTVLLLANPDGTLLAGEPATEN